VAHDMRAEIKINKRIVMCSSNIRCVILNLDIKQEKNKLAQIFWTFDFVNKILEFSFSHKIKFYRCNFI